MLGGGPHTTVHQFRSNQPATMQSLCFSLLYSLHHLGFPTLFHFFSYLFLPLTEIPLTLKLYDIFIIIYVLEHVYMVAKSLILSISNKLFIYLYAIEMINIRFKAMCVIFPNSSYCHMFFFLCSCKLKTSFSFPYVDKTNSFGTLFFPIFTMVVSKK